MMLSVPKESFEILAGQQIVRQFAFESMGFGVLHGIENSSSCLSD